MKGIVIIDTNIMVLLIVGAASKEYITKHKRLEGYTIDDFDLLGLLVAEFSEIVLLPHILAEVSNISRMIAAPARAETQSVLATLIATCPEIPVQSLNGSRREEFGNLGLTDTVILHFCTMQIDGLVPTLLTTDTEPC
jgi:hypothetical protein